MPSVEQRPEQPYVAVRETVTMTTVARIADRTPEVFGWLGERGIAPAGPPFFKYDVIDMGGDLVIEAGVPVATPADVPDDAEVFAAVLPAGRYAVVQHTGHPDELEAVTRDLLDWAAAQGLAFDMTPTPEGEMWGARLEWYLSDPAVEPDMNRWDTELAFRLAD
jgi:effector-binding domain-containing protein